ncbi:acyl dehydratase [Caldalkalibacillus uzonensis]|uniref:Acyl dehydratase n=1 Tax=Caldalkalibacillus uzonensis TaxID=353224 RepID=A0ABU0CWK9_9BACI|nr:MaoC family dehydratase [Caldalkalibacillus uzonensis]MDQ0340809.1 acyl dehydratase [Caldalkalibacillus uzonensis]
MIFVGDTITVSGKVIEKEEKEQGDVYTFDVQARNQKGASVASGWAKFICYKA